MGDSDGFTENAGDETWISLVVRLEKVHMANTLGLPSVRGRNHVMDRTKLLFHDIGSVKLGLQRGAWNGKQDKDFVAWLKRPLTRSAVIPALCSGTLLGRVLCSHIESMTESLTGAKDELDNVLLGAAQVCVL